MARIFGLDVLRAFAIITVVIGHGRNLIPDEFGQLDTIFKGLTFDGVSVFFVLSGFLIGRIIIKDFSEKPVNGKNLLNFWIRRWFRTLPNYYFILIILILFQAFNIDSFSLGDYKRYFLFLQNINFPHPRFFGEAWSLSVEEWFYLITPILIFVLIKVLKLNLEAAILVTAAFIIILSFIFRLEYFFNEPLSTIRDWDVNIRKQVVTRLDSIMYGVISAYTSIKHSTFWSKFKTHFFIIGLLLFLLMKLESLEYESNFFTSILFLPLVSISVAFMLPVLSNWKTSRITFFHNLITRISLISYSLYLIHLSLVQNELLPIFNFKANNMDGIPQLLIYFILSFLLAELNYRFFENPFTRLRDKFSLK